MFVSAPCRALTRLRLMIEHFGSGGTLQDVGMEKLHQAWRHAFGSQPATP